MRLVATQKGPEESIRAQRRVALSAPYGATSPRIFRTVLSLRSRSDRRAASRQGLKRDSPSALCTCIPSVPVSRVSHCDLHCVVFFNGAPPGRRLRVLESLGLDDCEPERNLPTIARRPHDWGGRKIKLQSSWVGVPEVGSQLFSGKGNSARRAVAFLLSLHQSRSKWCRIRCPPSLRARTHELCNLKLEPKAGIEPATFCLQNSCSAAELLRRK